MEIRKLFCSILLFTVLSISAGAQGKLVTGIVRDNRKVAVTGVTICQINSNNCTTSDRNGIFHLLLEQENGMSLQVKCPGFNPLEIVIDDTSPSPLEITLTPTYLSDDFFLDNNYSGKDHKIIMRSAINTDLISTDFSQFTSALGSYNTDLLKLFCVASLDMGASFSGIYAGFGLGLGYSHKDDYDTLTLDLNNSEYKLDFGYDLVSSHRIKLTPMLSVRWLRCRLLNYPGEHKISLNNYLEDRDLDLRFNQTIMVAGLNIEYLMYSDTGGRGDYWSVGISGGYAVKLNNSPWVYSEGNRLITDSKININPFTLGIHISFYNNIK